MNSQGHLFACIPGVYRMMLGRSVEQDQIDVLCGV